MSTSTRTAKKYVEALFEYRDIHADRVVAKSDGRLMVTKEYYYRHGRSAEEWGSKVQSAIGRYGKVVETRNNRRPFRGGSVGSEFEAYVVVTDFASMKAEVLERQGR